ncbi:MAG: ribosomal protein [Rickettsiales bacterium]|jgi:large subunit ribosomal protein L22|nr:ribosomal protein [Rickettsiales bacterium]
MATKNAKRKEAVSSSAEARGNVLRTSPRKLNLVAGLIRGMGVGEALVQLTFCKRRISGELKKVLQSAIANAENNHNLDVDALYVKEVSVGKAFTIKRFHARARGRGAKILKPFSKVRIIVAEKEEGTS